jgi:hypothetical protein
MALNIKPSTFAAVRERHLAEIIINLQSYPLQNRMGSPGPLTYVRTPYSNSEKLCIGNLSQLYAEWKTPKFIITADDGTLTVIRQRDGIFKTADYSFNSTKPIARKRKHGKAK